MGVFLLLLVSVPLCIYSARHAVRAFREVREKNRKEPVAWKRVLNWPAGMIWSAYLVVFSFGLVLNNLVFD